MAHEKLKSLIVMVAVFACVGAISWAVVNSHAHSEVSPQEQARDVATAYIKADHPEMAPFIVNLLGQVDCFAETSCNFAQ